MKTPTSTPHGVAVLLAFLAAIGPFAIDTYLPSFHDIGTSLHATPLQVQQTLSFYLLPFAVMALWHGAISDALGRRRVVLVSLALFALASFGCVFATRIEHLWLMRALQGATAGAGIVISRAIVRDLFEGAAAQRLMSRISMMFAAAPIVAPLIGGHLQNWFGWRSVFVFLFAAVGLLCLACWRFLPETLPPARRQSMHPAFLARSYWKVLTSGAFLLIASGMSLSFAGHFVYILSAPVFLMRHLGVSETGFLWLFVPAMLGTLAGAWLSGRFAGKFPPRRTIRHAYLVMGSAALLNLAISFGLPPGLPWSVLPIMVYSLGLSLALPSLTLLSLDLFPEQRGMTSSCQMFLQSMFNSLLAGMIVPLLWGSTRFLALGMGSLFLLGGLATWLHLSGAKSEKQDR